MFVLQLSISSPILSRALAISDLAWMLTAVLSVSTPDHIFPSGGFSSNGVNRVKPVQEADKSLDPSMFQQSSMRRSCLTSKFVHAVLETSMYFSGTGKVLLSASNVWLWVQRDGGKWSFLTSTKNHLSLHQHLEVSLEVVEVETLLIFLENFFWHCPRIGCSRIKVDVLSSWSPPGSLIRPSAAGKINSPFFGKYHLFCIESFRVDFRCVHRFQLLNVCNHYVTLPNSPRVQSVSEEQSRLDFLSKLMDSWLVLCSKRVILNQWTKWNDWSIKWLPKTSFIWSLPIRQDILNVSQKGITFHRICPPIFIQTWLQQYCRGTFFYSAHCSFSNPICFWSVWCWRTMIPEKIFTSLAKFQGIVSVNDFRLPLRVPGTFASFSGFIEKFLVCTDTPGSIKCKILHHDCISMIVSRFTIFTENFVIGCNQITKFFCTMYDSANTSSAGALVILVLWQISQFRSFGNWV